MSLVSTPICDSGWQARDFSLKNIDKKTLSLKQVQGKNATLVMFICNHCPYVISIIDSVVEQTLTLKQQYGVGIVAIMPNDYLQYPQDSFENMIVFAEQHHFHFPYLIDSSQTVAKNYGAVCTPDFFGFDADLGLQYRGRFSDQRPSSPTSRPSNSKPTNELLEAMIHISKGQKISEQQLPSMGCSIKWK